MNKRHSKAVNRQAKREKVRQDKSRKPIRKTIKHVLMEFYR